jgi:hypothetical protein
VLRTLDSQIRAGERHAEQPAVVGRADTRNPEGATPITGYEYEPWHFRYVGVDLAAEMHEQGTETLEEFFDLPAAPDYGG